MMQRHIIHVHYIELLEPVKIDTEAVNPCEEHAVDCLLPLGAKFQFDLEATTAQGRFRRWRPAWSVRFLCRRSRRWSGGWP